ncbi:MAG: NAD-dependent epimerase/dehydratase family protein [Phycisphaerae bacterium]
MRALVTGGGGFIGSRIAHTLHDRGDHVTAIGRRRYPHLETAGIHTIQGDLRDPATARRACAGMDCVFHVAGVTGVWGPRSWFWGINVDATQNVIDACRAAGVPRLVFTSSPSVVFGEHDVCGVDESHPYPPRYLAHYPATKAEAERRVLAANATPTTPTGPVLSTVALRPHLVWGPGDPHLIPRVVDRARRGKLTQVGDGRNLVDITYIDNAADAHILAADALAPGAPCAGRAYFITQGQPVRIWPWFRHILAELGISPPKRTVSYNAAKRAGALLEATYRLLRRRREPIMTRFVASQLAKSHYFDISAARRDLGYEPGVTTDDGVARLIAWLRHTPTTTAPRDPQRFIYRENR